jgi:hypothetical protein
LSSNISITILIVLVITNAVYVTITDYFGPIIALVLYGLVSFVFWRLKHCQAGIIAGILGFGVHIYEIIAFGLADIRTLTLSLLITNLLLPVPLVYFSYKAYRQE